MRPHVPGRWKSFPPTMAAATPLPPPAHASLSRWRRGEPANLPRKIVVRDVLNILGPTANYSWATVIHIVKSTGQVEEPAATDKRIRIQEPIISVGRRRRSPQLRPSSRERSRNPRAHDSPVSLDRPCYPCITAPATIAPPCRSAEPLLAAPTTSAASRRSC